MSFKITPLKQITSIIERLSHTYPDRTLCTQYAWWILQAVTDKKQAEILAQSELILTDQQVADLERWIVDSIDKHMPIAYLIGWVPFADLIINVKPPILIPRPETEEWVINLINQYEPLKHASLSILDLCSGTGCIALACARAFSAAHVIGTDINEDAVLLARENAQHNKLSNVTFVTGDLYGKLPHAAYDVIVSNPPYIDPRAWHTLDASVTTWEDRQALIAADNGLAIIKKIIAHAPYYVRLNATINALQLPNLILEIDETQGELVAQEMKNASMVNIVVHKDLAGKDRVVSGRVMHVAAVAKNTS